MEFITTKRAAKMLQLSNNSGDRTVRKYLYKGWLKGHLQGRDWFVSLESVQKRIARLSRVNVVKQLE